MQAGQTAGRVTMALRGEGRDTRSVCHGVEELGVVDDGCAGVPAALELPQVFVRLGTFPDGITSDTGSFRTWAGVLSG